MNEAIVERNLRLLRGIKCLMPSFVLVPVFVLFFQARGLSQTEIFVSQAVFTAVVFVVELPTGWFADQYGYKKSLLVGLGLIIAGYSAYLLDHGLASILLAEVLCGTGFGFVSGADSSMALESLKSINQKERFTKEYGTKVLIYGNTVGLVLGLAGAAIAMVNIYATVVVQVCLTAITWPLALRLQDPPKSKPHPSRAPIISVRSALKDMGQTVSFCLHKHRTLKWLIVLSAVLSPSLQIAFWVMQPYFQAANVPVGLFGALSAVWMLAGIVFALLTERCMALGSKRIFIGYVLICSCSFAVLAIKPSVLLLPVFFGFCFVQNTFFSIMETYIHEEVTDSSIRATVLSTRRLVSQLVFTVTGPLAGFLMDVYSLQVALATMAIACGVVGVAVLLRMARLKSFIATPISQSSSM